MIEGQANIQLASPSNTAPAKLAPLKKRSRQDVDDDESDAGEGRSRIHPFLLFN